MNKYVLIAAAGSGSRMQKPFPKQFALIAGKPLLVHTIHAFLAYARDIQVVLILQAPQIKIWKELCKKYYFSIQHQIVEGGPTRFHSVKNGLKYIPDDALVAVHDGVRPLVGLDTISRVFYFAEKFGSAIPVIQAEDSVRMVDGGLSKALNRESVRLVQTPQCFTAGRLKKAFNKNYHESFTDEAAVWEVDGERLFLVDGNPENIKVTHPSDLLIAEALLSKKQT